jgi:hypothetical protein
MGILATLSRPSVKTIEKSKYDQAILDFAMASDSQKPVNGTEAENDQVTSEFAPSCDSRELVDETESDNGLVTSEFAPPCDSREFVDRAETEFDQIISDLYKRAEDQCNRIIANIKSEAEDSQAISEFVPSCDYRELFDGAGAESDPIISDLYQRAEDQYYQIISSIEKAFETDLEYANACCDLESVYEDKGVCDCTELQKKMRTIKHFRLHIETCDIYAIEQRADASLVGSCGPLAEDSLEDLNSYDYSDKQNDWVQKNFNRLILWFP